MTPYSNLPDDGTMSEAERGLAAIRESREIRADDGPARTFHPDGPCRYALDDCPTCEDMEAAYRRTDQALMAAFRLLNPTTGAHGGPCDGGPIGAPEEHCRCANYRQGCAICRATEGQG